LCDCFLQYFGGGKTTLGEKFPDQIHQKKVCDFFEGKLKMKEYARLRPEWELLQKRQIKRVSINVMTVSDIVREAAAIASGNENIQVRDPKEAAKYLIDYAQANGPTLFHFDEVGSDPGHDLFRLRQLAVAVWTSQIMNSKRGGEMPRVYFLVTGKSTQSFENIGKTGGTSEGSPSGSHFLILDMLSPDHIGEVRGYLQDKTKVKVPLELQGLHAEDLRHFDECLAIATGGAPRLLLYTLRALHHLRTPLGSPPEIHTAVFETVFNNLLTIKSVSSEFSPSSFDSMANRVFGYLFAFYLRGDHLTATHEFSIDGKQEKLHTLLRFQPFFLSRPPNGDPDPSAFTLRLPLYHLKAAERKFATTPDSVPMLLLSMAGAALPLGEPWRVFELLPAYIISVKAALDRILGRQAATWAEVLPTLFANSNVAKKIAFNLGPKPFLVSTVTAQLPEAIEADAEMIVQKGGAVVGRDKSPSEDLFHVQRLVGGKGHGVVAWQQKFLLETKLQMAMVRDEVAKGVKRLPALLVIFASTVGPELVDAIDAADKRVLVLPSWDEKTAAEFAFGSASKTTMATAAAEERKSVLLWRAHVQGGKESSWFVFPDQDVSTTTKSLKPGKGAHLIVRTGLEVVIPHHEIVRELVGTKMFDALAELARGKSPDATSAVVNGLDDLLSGRRLAPAAETRATYHKLLNDEVEALEKKKHERGLTQRDEDYLTELYKKQDVLRKKFASQD
jgi:hypothetical protein